MNCNSGLPNIVYVPSTFHLSVDIVKKVLSLPASLIPSIVAIVDRYTGTGTGIPVQEISDTCTMV